MSRREETFTGAKNTKISYGVWEPAGAPRGLLVISHGLGEHGRRYDHVAARLLATGLRIAIPDHRGHGVSEGPRAVVRSVSEFTDDLGTVFERERVDGAPMFLLGHSMGGGIALDYALDHQETLAGLVLSGATVVPADGQPKLLLAVAKVLGRVAPSLPTAKLDSSDVSRDPAVVEAYDNDPLVFHGKVPAGLAGALVSTMESFPKRLPQLTIPILVMHGSEDKLTSPAGSELVVELATSSDKTLTIYPGLYHEIFNEPEQDAVLDDVATWLEAHLS